MVKNAKLLEKFEKEKLKKEKLSLDQKHKILDAMYQEVVFLNMSQTKKYSIKDKVIYKIAKVINAL